MVTPPATPSLRGPASALARTGRTADACGRFGGNEFIVSALLLDTADVRS
jgi:hypothetical protein